MTVRARGTHTAFYTQKPPVYNINMYYCTHTHKLRIRISDAIYLYIYIYRRKIFVKQKSIGIQTNHGFAAGWSGSGMMKGPVRLLFIVAARRVLVGVAEVRSSTGRRIGGSGLSGRHSIWLIETFIYFPNGIQYRRETYFANPLYFVDWKP